MAQGRWCHQWMRGCGDGDGVFEMLASVISSDLKLGRKKKLIFYSLILYSCSLISFPITHTILRPGAGHYSQRWELRVAKKERVSLFSLSKHSEQEKLCAYVI